MVAISVEGVSAKHFHYGHRRWSDIFGFFRVPYLEQAIQRPLNAANSVLLVLLGIFGSKSLR
jgi:hypothetical protein